MGRRGPKPTPTKVLEARGSWRAETRKGEPVLPPGLPPCPGWVRESARQHWPEIGRLLEGVGIMSAPHTVALALLVDALADFIDFTNRAAEQPPTVTTAGGSIMQHPLIGMKNQAWSRVLQALREFGMTPSSLTNVRSIPDEAKPSKTGLDKYRPGPRLAV